VSSRDPRCVKVIISIQAEFRKGVPDPSGLTHLGRGSALPSPGRILGSEGASTGSDPVEWGDFTGTSPPHGVWGARRSITQAYRLTCWGTRGYGDTRAAVGGRMLWCFTWNIPVDRIAPGSCRAPVCQWRRRSPPGSVLEPSAFSAAAELLGSALQSSDLGRPPTF
jgi:hypothetical protein